MYGPITTHAMLLVRRGGGGIRVVRGLRRVASSAVSPKRTGLIGGSGLGSKTADTSWSASGYQRPRGRSSGDGTSSSGGGRGSSSSNRAGSKVTLHAGECWAPLIASGVFGSGSDVMRLLGLRGELLRDIESRTGVSISISNYSSESVTLRGAPAAVTRARTAIDALVVPSETLDVGARWGNLVTRGYFASTSDVVRHIHGLGASRMRVVQRISGAMVWAAPDGSRVFMSGDAAAVAAAHAAIDVMCVPCATVDVAGAWGTLISSGVHASPSALMRHIMGPRRERAHAIEVSTGAVVWTSNDDTRVFLAGDAAAIARGRAALDTLIVPARTIDAGVEWARLIADGVHDSTEAVWRHLIGPRGERVRQLEAASGAVIWSTDDRSRVFLAGSPDGVTRARSVMERMATPRVTIDVAQQWVATCGGQFASPLECVRHLIVSGAERLRAAERACGALVWASSDGARVFVSGDDAAVAHTRPVLDQILAPGATPDIVSPLLRRMDEFARAGRGHEIVFRDVGSAVRSILHRRAHALGLYHESRGVGEARVLCVLREAPPRAAAEARAGAGPIDE